MGVCMCCVVWLELPSDAQSCLHPSPQATGARLGTLLESFIGMFLGLVISFAYNWVLSFVILGVVPIVVISSALEVTALTGQAGKTKKDLESAGKVGVASLVEVILYCCTYHVSGVSSTSC